MPTTEAHLCRLPCQVNSLNQRIYLNMALGGHTPNSGWPWLCSVSTSETLAKGDDYHIILA